MKRVWIVAVTMVLGLSFFVTISDAKPFKKISSPYSDVGSSPEVPVDSVSAPSTPDSLSEMPADTVSVNNEPMPTETISSEPVAVEPVSSVAVAEAVVPAVIIDEDAAFEQPVPAVENNSSSEPMPAAVNTAVSTLSAAAISKNGILIGNGTDAFRMQYVPEGVSTNDANIIIGEIIAINEKKISIRHAQTGEIFAYTLSEGDSFYPFRESERVQLVR